MNTSKRTIHFLSLREVNTLIGSITRSTMRARRDRALIATLFSTGLRISECLKLQRKAIDETKTFSTLECAIQGKGNYQRAIYFSPQALIYIKEYLLVRKDNDPRLFPLGSRAAQYMIQRRARKAGFSGKRITPHVLRHSFATDLLSKGVNLRLIQEFLGHRSITSTEIYTNVTNSQLRELHEKLYAIDSSKQ